ncbi:hypothetical protein PACTADRAFT_31 [Pachysolen tannophilus NRRL Y-2460]|uniref:PCI domain-containing protein n=1 Tax=Pachysolen tannophilus NRRL Y-2460 TaxID=669874 RepID=A0A1E4U0I9_PACTA|nr:hypothetical protein PACTADRAFT_31 [Pachysolen tannophilus NRRL Y-2460]
MSIPSIEEAREAVKSNDLGKAEQVYLEILSTISNTNTSRNTSANEKLIQIQEAAILELGELYSSHNKVENLVSLLPKVPLELIHSLIREFKKLDDKSSLVEVQLLESKIYFALKNFPKSRSSLTSARTSANSIYCPTNIQAELDLLGGVLNAEDKDFKTAYSYFYESFENSILSGSSETQSIKILKYMLMSKIMLQLIDDVNNILNNKNVVKFTNSKEIEAMKAVSKAASNRSLKEFEECLTNYQVELTLDPIIRSHLTDLYDSLLERNLMKLIEPYSMLEISFISNKIGLSVKTIEAKLSQMILDKIFYGVLDQGNGWLIIYTQPQVDENYDLSLELIKNMSNAVDLLYEKASSLN